MLRRAGASAAKPAATAATPLRVAIGRRFWRSRAWHAVYVLRGDGRCPQRAVVLRCPRKLRCHCSLWRHVLSCAVGSLPCLGDDEARDAGRAARRRFTASAENLGRLFQGFVCALAVGCATVQESPDDPGKGAFTEESPDVVDLDRPSQRAPPAR